MKISTFSVKSVNTGKVHDAVEKRRKLGPNRFSIPNFQLSDGTELNCVNNDLNFFETLDAEEQFRRI